MTKKRFTSIWLCAFIISLFVKQKYNTTTNQYIAETVAKDSYWLDCQEVEQIVFGSHISLSEPFPF